MSNPFWLTDAQMAWLWRLFPQRNDPCGSNIHPPQDQRQAAVLPRKRALSNKQALLMDADPTFLAMRGLKRQAGMLDGTGLVRQHGAALSERHHGISV